MWPFRKLVCARCGLVIRSKDFGAGSYSHECSHVFFDKRDKIGLRIVRGKL